MTGSTGIEWRLREAGPEDAAALALIGAATFLETFAGVLDGDAIVAHCQKEHSQKAYETYLAKGGCGWLAEVAKGGAPVGFALTGAPDLPGVHEGDVELKRIYTLSRLHGTGLGAALMQAVVAASADYQRIILGVYAKNERAIAFYLKQGFEPVATRQFNVGGTLYDDQVLARPIGEMTGTPAFND